MPKKIITEVYGITIEYYTEEEKLEKVARIQSDIAGELTVHVISDQKASGILENSDIRDILDSLDTPESPNLNWSTNEW